MKRWSWTRAGGRSYAEVHFVEAPSWLAVGPASIAMARALKTQILINMPVSSFGR
jgi:hypothetical protein